MALAMRQRCALLRQRGVAHRSLRSSPVTAATAASKERVDAKVWLLRLVEAGLLTSHAWYLVFLRAHCHHAVMAMLASAQVVIERYYEAYNSGDIDTIAGLLAEDVSYHGEPN